MAEDGIETRDRYRHFYRLPTRWMDNDVFGHVNNVTYYSYIDTVVNRYLIDEGGFDFANDPVIGLAVESQCRFRRSLTYPEDLDVGLRVGHLGTSSVRYEVGIFRCDDDRAAAHGHFVHVFVDRVSNRPTPVPSGLRQALARILVPAEDAK